MRPKLNLLHNIKHSRPPCIFNTLYEEKKEVYEYLPFYLIRALTNAERIFIMNSTGDDNEDKFDIFFPERETKKVSDYYLKYFKTATVLDITGDRARRDFPRGKDLGLLVLSFPVYAEDIPGILVPFLKGLVGDYAVINVTYGRVAAGKALSRAAEILKKQGFTVIGGAEVPAAHCYLREKKNSVDLAELAKVAEKIENGDFRAAAIPRQAKHPLAGFFPALGTDSRSGNQKSILRNAPAVGCAFSPARVERFPMI